MRCMRPHFHVMNITRLTRQTAFCIELHVTGPSEEALVSRSRLLIDCPAFNVTRSVIHAMPSGSTTSKKIVTK